MATSTSTERIDTHSRRRRFRLTDAIILIGATAVGLAATRTYVGLVEGVVPIDTSRLRFADLPILLAELMTFSVPLVAAWSLALIPLRLLGPRPRFRRLARQPGLVASFAVALTIGFYALPLIVVLFAGQNSIDNESAEIGLILIPELHALAVLASWMTLALSGTWRAEPDWIDRCGRALGVLWVSLGFSVFVLLLWVTHR